MIRFFFTVAIILGYIRSYFTEKHNDIYSSRPARRGASEEQAEQPVTEVTRQRYEQGCLMA